MNREDIVAQLVGMAPRRLLEELARIAVALAKHDRARPEVELYLASGQVVRGRIVTVSEDRQGPIVVIQTGGNLRQPAVSFVRVDQVAAVHVADASVLVAAPVTDAPAPSKLELQRQVAAKLDGLKLSLKIELTATAEDDDRRAIGVLLPVLFDVLAAITADDMGKQAIASVQMIELAAGPNGEVMKQQRGFRIVAPKLLTEQFTHATLRRELEKHL